MASPVKDVKGSGAQRLDTPSASGPADEFISLTTIDPDGVLTQQSNLSIPVARVYGDGRRYTPIQNSTPINFVPGQYWIERIAGVDYWIYVDTAGVLQQLAPGGGGSPAPVPAIIALPNGVSQTLASVVVDAVGTIEWSLNLYKPAVQQRHHFRIVGAHNGTTVVDATTAYINKQGTIAIGALDVALSLVITGVGPAQTMDLDALASSTGWSAAIVAERMVSP